MAVMEDPVNLLAAALLSCLNGAVNEQPNPPGEVCYRVGAEVAHDLGQYDDLCCRGLAYVSLGDTYAASDSFPEQDIVRQSNAVCAPPSWAQEFNLGIVRCVPTHSGHHHSEPPTCAQWTAAALQNFADAAALRRTACCFRTWIRTRTGFFEGMSVVIQRQTQTSPNGGCVERKLQIVAQHPNCDCI